MGDTAQRLQEQVLVTLRRVRVDRVADVDIRRPTVLNARIEALSEAIQAVISVACWSSDLVGRRRWQIAAARVDTVDSAYRGRRVTELARTIVTLEHVGDELLEPTRDDELPRATLASLRVLVPGPTGELPAGTIVSSPQRSGGPDLRWEPDSDPTDSQRLDVVVRWNAQRAMPPATRPYRATSAGWKVAANDIATLCTGWAGKQDWLPPGLAGPATVNLARQLAATFDWRYPWKMHSVDVIEFLTAAGHIRTRQ